ncbi:SIR2 family NAD-dependent protein deacylase [Micromonospora echinofusca]|uniref:protein acetyllysine N-acetyltransferase n=1 Tax=Micromonospora echinofusca TaxID=47858 RepID=A0ABS3VIY2_MICEH|nr:Sir2 family NAD-dependent protein deacetylase [Micromonospora echinofusca]MBO4204479.1 NAD-dependent protein deacylase [Micromonospora echinofusca]
MNDDAVAGWTQGVTRVAVLTGAGISTDSGIPDYRGPDGVWTRDPAAAEVFTRTHFMSDPAVRARFWRTYLGHAAWHAEPNAAHRALAALEDDGCAVRILTQNIDGLHQKAGSAPRKVLELHGSMREVHCTTCRVRTPTADTLARVAAGETDPRCTTCGGILKLGVVLFGEHLDPQVVSLAEQIARACQLMLVVGSSLQVEPAASLCAVAVDAGARLVIVNRDPTPYDDLADGLVREPIGVALPRITAALTRALPDATRASR